MSLALPRTRFPNLSSAHTAGWSVRWRDKARHVDGFGLFALMVAVAGLVTTVMLSNGLSTAPPSTSGVATAVVATPIPLRPNAADICDRDGNCWVP